MIECREAMMKNRRILIVDDEPYNLLSMKIILQQSGFKDLLDLVDQANNGLEAYRYVKEAFNDGQYSYGLILMDCSMPIMDGFESTDNIRRFTRKHNLLQPRIIACTGHIEEEYI